MVVVCVCASAARLRRVCGAPAVRLPYWPPAVDWLSGETGYSGVISCGRLVVCGRQFVAELWLRYRRGDVSLGAR